MPEELSSEACQKIADIVLAEAPETRFAVLLRGGDPCQPSVGQAIIDYSPDCDLRQASSGSTP